MPPAAGSPGAHGTPGGPPHQKGDNCYWGHKRLACSPEGMGILPHSQESKACAAGAVTAAEGGDEAGKPSGADLGPRDLGQNPGWLSQTRLWLPRWRPQQWQPLVGPSSWRAPVGGHETLLPAAARGGTADVPGSAADAGTPVSLSPCP